jgi:hypothetical protein
MDDIERIKQQVAAISDFEIEARLQWTLAAYQVWLDGQRSPETGADNGHPL